MKRIGMLGTVLLFALSTVRADDGADGLESASQEALQKTQQLLNSPAARAEAMKGNAAAVEADQRAKSTFGGQTDAAYALAAKIMEKLAQKHQGKPEEMAAAMAKYQSNPHGFMELLGPAERAEFDRLVKNVEKQNPSAAGQLPKP